MICGNCQAKNPAEAKFCMSCGSTLAAACTNCGTELPAEAKFCLNCGQPVGERSAAPEKAPEPAKALLEQYIPAELLKKLESARGAGGMHGERRVVTMLFCDVEGSTAAAEGLDPEEWAEIMNGYSDRDSAQDIRHLLYNQASRARHRPGPGYQLQHRRAKASRGHPRHVGSGAHMF